MGDILSGVFGGGEQTSSETKPDANAQVLNKLKAQQLQQLFSVAPYSDFANPQGDLFSLDANSQALMEQASDPSNLMSLDEYMRLGSEAGGSFMEQIAGPQIASTLAMQGAEGSGA